MSWIVRRRVRLQRGDVRFSAVPRGRSSSLSAVMHADSMSFTTAFADRTEPCLLGQEWPRPRCPNRSLRESTVAQTTTRRTSLRRALPLPLVRARRVRLTRLEAQKEQAHEEVGCPGGRDGGVRRRRVGGGKL